MKKVRVTVSDFMFEILKGDAEYFKIPLGKIGNTLFKYFIDKNLSKIELEESSGKKVQFNLSKENEDIFFDVLREKKDSTEAELMRDIFFTYINNLRFKREEIIFYNTFKQIREAIKNNKKIGIKYHSTARIINPYFIEVSSKENRAYLFCYCEKNEDFRNYRISDIENIWSLQKEIHIKDKEYIEAIKKNFDPFLSYGNFIKVKMTEEGKALYERVNQNRPKLVKEEGDIYTFECSEKLAKVYFAQFYDDIEIIEPESLRESFKENFKRTYEMYIK